MDALVEFSRQTALSRSQVISIFCLSTSHIWKIFSCGVNLYCDTHMGKPKPKSKKTPWLKTKKKPGPRKKRKRRKTSCKKGKKKTSQMATQLIDWQCNNMVLVYYREKGGIIELQRVTTAAGVELIDNSD